MTDPLLDALARRFEKPKVHPDPVVWAKQELKIDLYSKQREILRLLEIVPKLAVKSCHSSGKSFAASLAAARFIAKYPPTTARVVSTAPSQDQVRAILWNEINALHTRSKGKLPGRVNQTEWWIGGYMAGIGRKPSDYSPETFQGLHAEHILIIIDEAGGVPEGLWTGVDTLATNIGAVMFAIGNPDDPTAEFKNICDGAPDNGWLVVSIPAWETPNLSGEIVPLRLRNTLLSREWVEDKRTKWGEDSALWDSKVEAEFPDVSKLTVIRLVDLEAACNGVDMPRGVRWAAGVQLGIDIAGSDTGDETVIRERRGYKIGRRWAVRSGEPEDVSDLIVQAQIESGATLLHVDATGIGFGFLADIRRRCPHVAVIPFVGQAGPQDREQYENRRAEIHWTVRDMLRRRELDLSNADNLDELKGQLMTVRYSLKKGKIIVEPKDEIRKRLDRSPDDGDALLLAAAPPSSLSIPVTATVHAATAARAKEAALAAATAARADAPVVIVPGPHPVPERVVPFGQRDRPRVRTLRAR